MRTLQTKHTHTFLLLSLKKLFSNTFLKSSRGYCYAIPSTFLYPLALLFFCDPRGTIRTPSPFGYSLFEKSESLLRVTKSLKGSPMAKKLFYKYFFKSSRGYCYAIPSTLLYPLAHLFSATHAASL